MQKTSEQIATETLFLSQLQTLVKVANDLLAGETEKDAWGPGIGIQLAHVLKQLPRTDVEYAQKALIGLENYFRKLSREGKTNTIPAEWYRPILNSTGEVVGYVVGHGAEVSSILAKNMVPHGVKI